MKFICSPTETLYNWENSISGRSRASIRCPDNQIVIRTIAAPVMVLYPIAAMVLSLFLQRQIELRETRDLVRKSEDQYKLLFDTMSQGVVYQSANGSIISMNSAAEQILGITLDQAQGRTSMDPNWRAILHSNA